MARALFVCLHNAGKRYLDWDLSDPRGRPLAEVRAARDEVKRRVKALVDELDGSPPS